VNENGKFVALECMQKRYLLREGRDSLKLLHHIHNKKLPSNEVKHPKEHALRRCRKRTSAL
jgi:hypothetical protein